MPWIDLRSDTVTQPTPAMRQAMANADVGDDVYGDDPVVRELEQTAATMLGKEAAVFVPSGVFGNQLAIFTHCSRGDEVILGDDCHIVQHENGAAAVISGVQLRTLRSNKGLLNPDDIEACIRVGADIHVPRTGLICLENAHSNGRVIAPEAMERIAKLARRHDVPVHLDGARIFNAAVHWGCDVREMTRHADTVMCCLSKGLAAPVGSMLAGPADFIHRARYNRKLLGGGWRQAGILAAAGLLALTDMTRRLTDDHANARYLAERLAELPGISLDRDDVHINMVWFQLPVGTNVEELLSELKAAHIKAGCSPTGRMRLMTHWQIDTPAIDGVVDVFRRVILGK